MSASRNSMPASPESSPPTRSSSGPERSTANFQTTRSQGSTRASARRKASQRDREHVALQRGLQLGLELEGDRAAFLRVYQDAGTSETALVLLNKGDSAQAFEIDARVSDQSWRDALAEGGSVTGTVTVPAHGVRVLISAAPIRDAGLLEALRALRWAASR